MFISISPSAWFLLLLLRVSKHKNKLSFFNPVDIGEIVALIFSVQEVRTKKAKSSPAFKLSNHFIEIFKSCFSVQFRLKLIIICSLPKGPSSKSSNHGWWLGQNDKILILNVTSAITFGLTCLDKITPGLVVLGDSCFWGFEFESQTRYKTFNFSVIFVDKCYCCLKLEKTGHSKEMAGEGP